MPFQGSSAIMEARIKEYFTEVSARVLKEAPGPKNQAKAVPNVAEKEVEDGGEQGVEQKVVAGDIRSTVVKKLMEPPKDLTQSMKHKLEQLAVYSADMARIQRDDRHFHRNDPRHFINRCNGYLEIVRKLDTTENSADKGTKSAVKNELTASGAVRSFNKSGAAKFSTAQTLVKMPAQPQGNFLDTQAVKGGKPQEAEALPSADDEWVTAGVHEEDGYAAWW